MKFFIIITFFMLSAVSMAQDHVDLTEFLNLSSGDTLVINIKNVDCQATSGDRYLILKNNSTYSIIRFKDFNMRLLVDGKELKLEKEKQDFLLNTKVQFQDAKVTVTQIGRDDFEIFMSNVQEKLQAENADSIKLAGVFCYCTLQLNDKILSREFKRWIELSED